MLKKSKKEFIKNKLKNSIKIKKIFKNIILKSIVQNQMVVNNVRALFFVKYKLNYFVKTNINDVCLNSSIYKKTNKHSNFSRYEFHSLCRSNKLSNWVVNSW